MGTDKGYDAKGFVEALKDRKIVPHIAIQGHVGKHGKGRKTVVPEAVAMPSVSATANALQKPSGWIKTTAGLYRLRCGV
ncbi:MAG: hypothetical protein WDN06_12465 [Asticcacaulis sp.]